MAVGTAAGRWRIIRDAWLIAGEIATREWNSLPNDAANVIQAATTTAIRLSTTQ